MSVQTAPERHEARRIRLDMRWTEAEIKVLIHFYPDYQAMADVLKHRSYFACRSLCRKLGLTKPKHVWTTTEDKLLTKLWREDKATVIAAFPGLTWNAISQHAGRIGLKMTTKRGDSRVYHTEADYTEKWMKKRAPRPDMPGRPVKKRPLDQRDSNGELRYIDDDFIRRMTMLYKQGMNAKQISVELGCGMNTLNRLRREQGIPARFPKGAKSEQDRTLHVSMPISLFNAIERAYFGRYRSKSMYVRALIKRDLGL